MKKSNGNQRARDAEGRFTSSGQAQSKSTNKSGSRHQSSGKAGNQRCRNDMGRFESCDS